MIGFSEYNDFYKKAIRELEAIKEDMLRYKKLKTDLRGYRLIKDIDGKIKELTLANTAMKREDLKVVYIKKTLQIIRMKLKNLEEFEII